MTGRALLQPEGVHAMAVSAARGLWQRCVLELTAPLRSAAKTTSRTSRLASAGDALGPVLEQPTLPTAFSRGRTGSGVVRESCRSYPARQSNWSAHGSPLSSGKASKPWEAFSRFCSTQFSTTESVTSTETVVVETTEGSSPELEFAPETESTLATPLVQAIQSQESVSAEKVPSSSAFPPNEQHRDTVASTDSPLANSEALQDPESAEREVYPGRIYVGGLPFMMKGEELIQALRELCSKYGVVRDVTLAHHQNQSKKAIEAGKHRGFAFVMMSTPEEADEAIKNLNGASVWGRVLTVSYSLKKKEPDSERKTDSTEKSAVRCKVYAGNLHEGTTRLDLLSLFSQHGTVVDVKLITELHSNRSRGFGFVTFAEEGQAIKAVLNADGSILDGSVIRVNIAKYPQGY